MRIKKALSLVLAPSLFVGVHASTAHATEINYLGREEMVTSQATLPSLSKVNDVLNASDQYIGTPYKWGTGPYSETNRYFDCSSFTQRVFGENGINLKRNSREQSTQGVTIAAVSHPEEFIGAGTVKPKGERLNFDNIKSSLKKGDLIFFDNEVETPNVEKIHHVAIYINEHTLLHATEAYGVNYTYFNDKRKSNIVVVKRMINETLPNVTQKQIISKGDEYRLNKTSFSSAAQFVGKVFGDYGISLPSTANGMSKVGVDTPRDQLKTGDLVFFDHDHDGNITHVAIYINEDKLLHNTVSQGVTYTPFKSSSYWNHAFVKGKRILDLKGSLPLNEEVIKTAISYLNQTEIEDIQRDENGQPRMITPNSAKFVQRVFYDQYVGMSKYMNIQQAQGHPIPLSDAKPGDLLFFDTNQDGDVNFIAFYVDADTMIQATSSGIIYKPLTAELKKKANLQTAYRIGM
ncbi:NlpC/P60 family protein [Hazenella coriacea]|uniref:NlpC/P60 family protein n=1 Tax=Hazenella coriacea TaxID=1179467 RepID=A0A4R3L702_9BACL|nr:NlpC/P60 family protein [Hazenella coriacea]TCS95691.1 NlpC/P60 family protein [Hazenella coriacea]